MRSLADEVDSLAAAERFSGVVRVDRDGRVELARAYGMAHRGHEIANTVDTQFAVASGTKGLTALAVVSLIEDGSLALSTTARSALGADLPLVGDEVTIEQLLSHRSGIGDYVDEEADLDLDDYLMPVPVHGEVVLGRRQNERVCEPAGMHDTRFLRSDELPGRAALGYLGIDGVPRTNVFHLPVRGSGDGGIYSTAADIGSLWRALFAGEIVSSDWVAEMLRPRSTVAEESMRYGLGFWLHESSAAVTLEGSDAGVSFRSVHDPALSTTCTVISNTSTGAWPVARLLDDWLSGER